MPCFWSKHGSFDIFSNFNQRRSPDVTVIEKIPRDTEDVPPSLPEDETDQPEVSGSAQPHRQGIQAQRIDNKNANISINKYEKSAR